MAGESVYFADEGAVIAGTGAVAVLLRVLSSVRVAGTEGDAGQGGRAVAQAGSRREMAAGGVQGILINGFVF